MSKANCCRNMEEIIKQNKSKSHKEFEKLLTQDWANRKIREGEIITGVVSEISKKFVFLNLNLKSEGAIPIEEFKLTQEIDAIEIGSKVEVLLEKIENKNGDVVASREKARKAYAWKKMERSFENKESVTGTIVSRCKGGFVVDVESCLCFLPGSQVDLRPLRNMDNLMRTPQTFECVKLDKKRGNIVLSRRAILEKTLNRDRDKIISKLSEGDVVDGTVKALVDWGCFVDLNGVDSLLHINEISYSRIEKPSDILSIGQTIKVKIIKIDESKKISVSVKALSVDPYLKAIHNYDVGKKYTATIGRVMDYGAFAHLEEGLAGLIHQSECSWTKKNIHPGKILSTSMKVKVEIIEKNIEKRRISLSYKNCLPNPWNEFAKNFKVGDSCMSIIKNVTDYALFATVKDHPELDGMCHYKNLSYNEKESELQKYKKNMLVKFKILELNKEKEKIRFGVRELHGSDPFQFFAHKKISDVVTLTVDSTSQNGIFCYATNKDMLFLIKKNQLALEPENQRPSRWAKGDRVDSKIISLDKETRTVVLSIRALEKHEKELAIKKFGSKDSGGTLSDILGPLLKKKTETKKK